jgi:hypothetical protein
MGIVYPTVSTLILRIIITTYNKVVVYCVEIIVKDRMRDIMF